MKWRYYKATEGMFKGNIFRKKRTVWYGYDRHLKQWILMCLPPILLKLDSGNLDDNTKELTEDELDYLEIWQETRTEILNRAENAKSVAKSNTKRLNVQTKGFYDDRF